MACFGNGVTTTSTSTNISNANNGTIAQLLKRIDQLQKKRLSLTLQINAITA